MTEDNFQIESAAITDRGLSEKRPHNEDSFIELKERGLFAVADGVGGAQAGDVASQMAVEILGEAFANSRPNSDAEEIMKIAIEHANASIYQMSQDLSQLSTMATTVVALHVSGNIATIGHVGDSRLYRLDARGSLFRETQDHSVVEEEVRAGRMTAAQAANHPSRNVISRALGAEPTVEIDMKTIMFEPNTSFLLCSDGITRHLDDFEIRELLISNYNSPTDICQQMKELCYQRGAEDNLTAIIIRVLDVAAPVLTEQKVEAEEATVATARQFEASTAQNLNPAFYNTEATTEPYKAPVAEVVHDHQPTNEAEPSTDEDFLMLDESETAQPEVKEETPVREQVVQRNEAVETAVKRNETEREVFTIETAESRNDGNGFGRLLTSLLLLIVGAIIGVGLYYFLMPKPTVENQPPAAPPMQMQDIELTSFEKNRRNVDNNPQQYIATNVIPPEDAEGYYLLGRAQMLNGNFVEAKKSFEEARNRLAQTNDVNSRILANEIIMGLTIINNPFAQQNFLKEINAGKANANSNANTNSAVNGVN